MFLKHNLIKAITLLLCASFFLSACGTALPKEDVKYFQPVSALSLHDTVTVAGIGEATHGNAEFVKVRRDVLEQLATRYGFRAFAIEGDFGGSQMVNDYVLNGSGTAVEAVKAIGFAIYRTQEMVDLVEWIRQYNQSVAAEARIHFYGYDMQRYDHNKNGLLAFFQQVDPTLVEPYQAKLADLNDDTVFDQLPEKIQAGLKAIKEIRTGMNENKARYVAASSEQAYGLADQFAASIEENATLRGTNVNYSEQRDQYMAEKVRWIIDYEISQGRGKVLIAGHNGHIEKSAAAAQYRSMGNRLQEKYGTAYFTIGTEFVESTFNCKDEGSGERKTFSVKNKNGLNKAFNATGVDVAYLDIQSALKSAALKPLLTSKQAMSNIGDSFTDWYGYLPMFYTLQMVPEAAYDAVIFVRKATPTTMLSE